jgi:preprotein translocase subunit YajC
MEDQFVFLVPITLFAAIAVVIYSAIQARNRERMAMIEKGYDASLLEGNPANRTGKYSALKIGMAAVGIGTGFLVAGILDMATSMNSETAYFSMITIFGGLGLIAYYVLMRRKEA